MKNKLLFTTALVAAVFAASNTMASLAIESGEEISEDYLGHNSSEDRISFLGDATLKSDVTMGNYVTLHNKTKLDGDKKLTVTGYLTQTAEGSDISGIDLEMQKGEVTNGAGQQVSEGELVLGNKLTVGNVTMADGTGVFLYKTSEDLYAALGYGETTIHKVINILKKYEAPKTNEELAQAQNQNVSKKSKNKKNDIIGLEGLLWSLAKCCSPIPGEPIVGVVTKSKGVSVHRLDCKCLGNIEPERMIDISWADTVSKTTYTAHLRIECQDRVGILRDILMKTGDLGINIVYSNIMPI